MHAVRLRALAAAGLALALVARPADADNPTTYVALGDSLAFGETDFTQNPSNGDRGYVSLFANQLATYNGGARPTVINLGVDGETTSTFLNKGTEGPGPAPGMPAYQLNSNYPNPPVSQDNLMIGTIANELAAGHSIGAVTLQLGANDLFVLANSPGFFAETPAQQQADIVNALQTIAHNDGVILTQLRALLPHASIVLLDYYDPFAVFRNHPSSPYYAYSLATAQAIPALNQLIFQEAAAFNAIPIDIYAPFVGHEKDYTHILDPVAAGLGPNPHPNDLGYQVIADQLRAVPEPTSLVLLGLGAAGALGLRRRRVRAGA